MPDLVVFGDSWVTGVGLGQPPDEISNHAFGSQLAQMLEVSQFTNCGIAGSSNSRTVLELLQYVKQMQANDTIAVFFITTPARSCVISHEGHIIDLQSGNNTLLGKIYVEHFSSTQQLSFECLKNIIAMQQISKYYGINDYYIVGWSDVDLNLPGIDLSKVYPKTCAQLLGYRNAQDFIQAPRNGNVIDDSKHPSIIGHQIIAQALYDFIK